MKKKQITLTGNAAGDFNKNNFSVHEPGGGNCVVINTVQTASLQSADYYVFIKPRDGDYIRIKGIYNERGYSQLPNNCCIVGIQGVFGFDFIDKCYKAAVTKTAAGFTIEINHITDSEAKAELTAAVSKIRTIKDVFFNNVKEAIKPDIYTKKDRFVDFFVDFFDDPDDPDVIHGKEPDDYDSEAKRIMELFRTTPFINIDPDDDEHIYIPLTGELVNNVYISGERLCAGHIKNLGHKGEFGSYMFEYGRCTNFEYYTQNPGDIKPIYIKFRDKSFIIAKPLELQHCTDGYFYLKLFVTHRFPQDAERITADYPEINISDEKTRDLEFDFYGQSGLRKPPPPPRLGKKTIYLPCEDMSGEPFLKECWCVKKGLFCFTVNFYTEDDIHTSGKDRQPYKSMPDSAPVLGNNGEYLMLHDYAVSFISHNGNEFFAVYKCWGETHYDYNPFGKYSFHKLIPLKDVLAVSVYDTEVFSEDDLFNISLQWNYIYQTELFGLTAKPVGDKTFEALERLNQSV